MAAKSMANMWEALGWRPQADDLSVFGICADSRKVKQGDLFVALAQDPKRLYQHITQAQAQGVVAIVVDENCFGIVEAFSQESDISTPVWLAKQLPNNLVHLAAMILDDPASDMHLIGITGTNGKTSVSHFLAQSLSQAKLTCGVIGTAGYGMLDGLQPGINTTPDIIDTQNHLASMKAQGAKACAIEVSSHAIDQARVTGLQFDTVVFTNLSRDHLDYHGSMVAYGNTKARLLAWPGLNNVVINLDNEWCRSLVAKLVCQNGKLPKLWTYSLKSGQKNVSVSVKSVAYSARGIVAQLATTEGEICITSSLYGEFNVSNLLASLACLLAAGLPLAQIEASLNAITPVIGRMERFSSAHGPTVIVDYAHTPSALEAALKAIRKHLTGGKLWCVFGCGGDRDKGKRPQMAVLAENLADKVVVTDDNPRYEHSTDIIAEIMTGFANPEQAIVISDRKSAIGFAINQAADVDIILLAGKGHEDYQEIKGQRFQFSDRSIVTALLQGRAA